MLTRVLFALATMLAMTNAAGADEGDSRDHGWGGDWTKTDTAIEAVVLTTLAIDYVQTKRLLADGRMESNMLLASGDISPDAYFLTAAATHVIAMRVLPPRWRHVAQGVTIGVQSRAIARNWQAGYTLSF